MHNTGRSATRGRILRQYSTTGLLWQGQAPCARVLRGDAFWHDHQHVRCASRTRYEALQQELQAAMTD
jgi:hypothetical protein